MVFYSFMSEKLLITSKYLKLNNNFLKKKVQKLRTFQSISSSSPILFVILSSV